jgi:hypothetical protein
MLIGNVYTHKLQITRQHVSTFLLNMRSNQILLRVAVILLLVLLHLNSNDNTTELHER